MRKVGIAVIGCGAISGRYIPHMVQQFEVLNVIGVADIIPERSRARAEEYGLRQMTNQEVYDCPEVEIVVNLTYPTAHYEVTKAALMAGKHVWSEKMMAVSLEEADELVRLAEEKGLRLAMAPDTFLGGGLQTCRRIIDAGLIGEPMMAQAVVARSSLVVTPLAENRRMTLSPGGGIPFDMGGYYLTALVNMLGPIRRAAGFAQLRRRTFLNVKSPRFGDEIQLDTPTNMAGTLEFAGGVLANVAMESESFMETRRLEVYGDEGTLVCPDPNNFGGPVKIIRRNNKSLDPYEFPLTHGYSEGCNRGLGVAEMAWAIVNGRPHRATLGYHVFEAVHGIWRSGDSGTVYEMQSSPDRPAPLASGYVDNDLMETALAL